MHEANWCGQLELHAQADWYRRLRGAEADWPSRLVVYDGTTVGRRRLVEDGLVVSTGRWSRGGAEQYIRLVSTSTGQYISAKRIHGEIGTGLGKPTSRRHPDKRSCWEEHRQEPVSLHVVSEVGSSDNGTRKK